VVEDDKVVEVAEATGKALRGEGFGAPLLEDGEKGLLALLTLRFDRGDGKGLGAGCCSCVLELKAFIKLEILGLIPLVTEAKAEGGEEGDEGPFPLEDGGWSVLVVVVGVPPVELLSLEEGLLVRRSKLVID